MRTLRNILGILGILVLVLSCAAGGAGGGGGGEEGGAAFISFGGGPKYTITSVHVRNDYTGIVNIFLVTDNFTMEDPFATPVYEDAFTGLYLEFHLDPGQTAEALVGGPWSLIPPTGGTGLEVAIGCRDFSTSDWPEGEKTGPTAFEGDLYFAFGGAGLTATVTVSSIDTLNETIEINFAIQEYRWNGDGFDESTTLITGSYEGKYDFHDWVEEGV